jgi:hypothetical protein
MIDDEKAIKIFCNRNVVKTMDKKLFVSDVIHEPDTFTLINSG